MSKLRVFESISIGGYFTDAKGADHNEPLKSGM